MATSQLKKRKFNFVDATTQPVEAVQPADAGVLASLPDHVLAVLHEVTLKPGDPGAIFIYSSDNEIHVCLGQANSPVPQGATAAASSAALRAFVVAQFHAEHDNAEVQAGSGIFHQLNLVEYLNVIGRYVHDDDILLQQKRKC